MARLCLQSEVALYVLPIFICEKDLYPAGGFADVGQSEVVRRKALKTGLSQKILMQT